MSDHSRRNILRLGALTLACLGGLASGALSPRTVLAAWPKEAFEAPDTAALLQTMFPGASVEASDKVSILAPAIAENGTVVPISISAALPGVTALHVILDGNPRPLAASYSFGSGAQPRVSTRFKLARTQNVIVVAEANGKLHSAKQEIKVTIGGCGG